MKLGEDFSSAIVAVEEEEWFEVIRVPDKTSDEAFGDPLQNHSLFLHCC